MPKKDKRAIAKKDMMSNSCDILQYHYDLDVYIIKGTDLCYDTHTVEESSDYLLYFIEDSKITIVNDM